MFVICNEIVSVFEYFKLLQHVCTTESARSWNTRNSTDQSSSGGNRRTKFLTTNLPTIRRVHN